MSVLHVACAAEGREYVAHSAAMLHSVVECNPDFEVAVHYMHGPDVDPADARRLAGMVEAMGASISFIDVPDSRVEGLPTRDFTRKATWYRIFLPELRPDVDRVVYLDCDLLAVESLRELWETELGDGYLAAVTNVIERRYAHRPAELGLPAGQAYFNAGVLVMNLAAMRRDRSSEALLDYGRREGRRLLWRDQDALNVVLGARRVELHPRWNCMNAFWLPWAVDVFGAEALEEAKRNPAIRHFEGPEHNKPWHLLGDRELRRLYLHHRRRTPWPRVRTTGRTPANLASALARRLPTRRPILPRS
jgi:lipopolysaccharide biosynthesis glycosyltransferase